MDYMNIILKCQRKRRKNSKASVTVRSFHYGTIKEEPSEYLRWIQYVPEHWNVEELEKKSFSELSAAERGILELRKKELKVQEAFENFVSDESTLADNALIVYQYMKKMTIPKYAKLKLTREQLKLCDDRVQAILGALYSEVISVLHQNCVDNMAGVVSQFKKMLDCRIKGLEGTDSLEDDYVQYMLKITRNYVGFRQLDNQIVAQLVKKRVY